MPKDLMDYIDHPALSLCKTELRKSISDLNTKVDNIVLPLTNSLSKSELEKKAEYFNNVERIVTNDLARTDNYCNYMKEFLKIQDSNIMDIQKNPKAIETIFTNNNDLKALALDPNNIEPKDVANIVISRYENDLPIEAHIPIIKFFMDSVGVAAITTLLLLIAAPGILYGTALYLQTIFAVGSLCAAKEAIGFAKIAACSAEHDWKICPFIESAYDQIDVLHNNELSYYEETFN